MLTLSLNTFRFDSGQYNIDVTHFGKHLKGSPFTSHVYDAGNVKVVDLPVKNSAVVHKPVSFRREYEPVRFQSIR